jgi:hypothetical protein
MARIELTAEESAFIAARIAEFVARGDTTLGNIAELNALPLCLGWTGASGIRSNGELVWWNYEGQGEPTGAQELDDPLALRYAQVAGAHRYPQLRRLIPPRPPNATACACKGLDWKCCVCIGTGWLDDLTKR